MTKPEELAVGGYSVETTKKGSNEFAGDTELPDGTLFYTVRLDESGWFDTLSHAEAIGLSTLTRVEHRLKRIERLLKEK